jgi:hypothetical protein
MVDDTMKRYVVMLCLGFAACQQPKPKVEASTDSATVAEPQYDGPKACDLISSDVANKVTGRSYKTGAAISDYGYDSQCQFDPSTAGDTAVMLVTLHAKGDIDPYKSVPGSTEVKDLGDVAVWNEPNKQLAIKKGDAVFSVFIKNGKQKDIVQLGRTALEKL